MADFEDFPPAVPREEEWTAARRAALLGLRTMHSEVNHITPVRNPLADEDTQFDGADELFRLYIEYDLSEQRSALAMLFTATSNGRLFNFGQWHHKARIEIRAKDEVVIAVLAALPENDRSIILRHAINEVWQQFENILNPEALRGLEESLRSTYVSLVRATEQP